MKFPAQTISELPSNLQITTFRLGLCCRVNANCPLVGPGPTGRVPFVGTPFRKDGPFDKSIVDLANF